MHKSDSNQSNNKLVAICSEMSQCEMQGNANGLSKGLWNKGHSSKSEADG